METGPPGSEAGRFLIEVVFALAIGVLPTLAAMATIPQTSALNELTKNKAIARNGAVEKIVEFQAMTLEDFHLAFADAEAADLLFMIDGLQLPPGEAAQAVITLDPDPVTEQAEFQAASLYDISIEVTWQGPKDTESVTVEATFGPLTELFLSP